MLSTTLQYQTDLDIRYGELDSIVRWCEGNIVEDWDLIIKKEAGREPGIYRFGFRSEKDYVNFLVWKK